MAFEIVNRIGDYTSTPGLLNQSLERGSRERMQRDQLEQARLERAALLAEHARATDLAHEDRLAAIDARPQGMTVDDRLRLIAEKSQSDYDRAMAIRREIAAAQAANAEAIGNRQAANIGLRGTETRLTNKERGEMDANRQIDNILARGDERRIANEQMFGFNTARDAARSGAAMDRQSAGITQRGDERLRFENDRPRFTPEELAIGGRTGVLNPGTGQWRELRPEPVAKDPAENPSTILSNIRSFDRIIADPSSTPEVKGNAIYMRDRARAKLNSKMDPEGKPLVPVVTQPPERTLNPMTWIKPAPVTNFVPAEVAPAPVVAAPPSIPEFATEADAEAAKLPSGTVIVIKGRKARVK